MKKLIKKICLIFKYTICLLLINSLILPSYASLSAADGSSFISKDQFENAMADFNSRLTTFEAGINSKIDSQVVSYLDRNGIWSRAEQVLCSPYFTYNATTKKYRATLPFNSSYLNFSQAKTAGTYFDSPLSFGQLGTAVFYNYAIGGGNLSAYNKNFLPRKVIENISKSGLMHVVVDISCKDAYKRSGCSFYTATSNLGEYSRNPPTVKASLCFCQASKTTTEATLDLVNVEEKGKIQFEKLDWTNPATGSSYLQINGATAVETGTYVLYFFVNKDNSLWSYINGYGGFNNVNAAQKWSQLTSISWSAGAGTLEIYADVQIGVY